MAKRKVGCIADLMVIRNFQGKGIGSKLLGKAHRYFDSMGIKKTKLITMKGNREFYEKAGYGKRKIAWRFRDGLKVTRKSPKKGKRKKPKL